MQSCLITGPSSRCFLGIQFSMGFTHSLVDAFPKQSSATRPPALASSPTSD